MLDWLTNLFSSSLGDIIVDIGDAIDKNVTSDEERLKLKNELSNIRIQADLKQKQMLAENEKEITKRWLSDNDHLITRLVRPISFVLMIILFVFIVIADGNIGSVIQIEQLDATGKVIGYETLEGFHINPRYHDMIENILMVMIVAYFGGRSYEKGERIKQRKE